MIDVVLPGPADFAAWRQQARKLLAAEVPPEQVAWRVAGDAADLFADTPPPAGAATAKVPRGFMDLAEVAIRHRDPQRFALLYRALWRLTHGEHGLLQTATDADTVRLNAMAKSVRRDAHKMHAFVRFRRIETPAGERFVAWFEPEHHILQAEAEFFVRRFAAMQWSILTPEASAHWDGTCLHFGPGGRRADAPAEDAQEDLWRAYYAAIFNPARLKPDAMRAEMPVRYWKNLPEAREIPRLLAEAPQRAAAMVARGASAPAAQRQKPVQPPAAPLVAIGMNDRDAALLALKQELQADRASPIAALATQAVCGEGPLDAPLMLVGEQPGDEEDIAGRPFVGPAGRLLGRALEEAGIPRPRIYVTNAVKHFKYKPMGKRRLHQSPDAGDITHYRPFLRREIEIVRPRLVVALGASALRALAGKAMPVTRVRGTMLRTPEGEPLFATVHPSYLLRLPDARAKQEEYARFVQDLKEAQRIAA